MADGTSAAEARVAATIVVVGGGCYGSYYVRQLARARAAGAITWDALVVVDRDAACRVAREQVGQVPALRVEAAEWAPWFDAWLSAASTVSVRADWIVPSPLMPHLMADWMTARARRRWPDRPVRRVPLVRPPAVPWQRAAPDGTHFVSFAEWTCPVNCIEPALCPAIRGPRTWSMPARLRGYVAAEAEAGRPIAATAVLHCAHVTYGVGMFPVADVLAGDAAIAAAGDTSAGAPSPVRALVGTVSHCHGALALLEVGVPAGHLADPTG